MKRNFLLLLCIVALMTACLASCAKECEHTFSDEWYNDANNHWHPATCDHGEIKDALGAHVDADENGVCDVCALETGHIHTFVDEWSMDGQNHWKVATCSHADVKGEFALHTDDNNDGVCEVCFGHVHSPNAAGYCKNKECGELIVEIDETSLDALVNAVVAQQWLVNGGSVDYNFKGQSNIGNDYVATKRDIASYIFGKNNYTYVSVDTTSVNAGVEVSGKTQIWHQLMDPETTFGVFQEDDNPITLDSSNVDRLRGYFIALSTLAGDYGVEGTLYDLYEAAIGDTVDELVVIPDTSENKVTFKYSYKTVFVNSNQIAVGDNVGSMVHNVNFFEVEVSFTYSDELALTGLYISVDCYTNDPGTNNYGEFLEGDVDLDYDPETDTFTMRENALPDVYTITVTQTLGERTEENPNPRTKFVPDSFEIFSGKESILDEEGLETGYVLTNPITEALNVRVGDVVNIYIGNYSPVGTSLHYIADQVSFVLYKDGEVVENAEDYLNTTAVAMFTFAGDLRSFFVVPKADGLYRLDISVFGELTHSVTIIAGVVSEDQIELGENQFAVGIKDSYSWSNEYTFTADKAGKYTFVLPEGIGFVNADAYDIAIDLNLEDSIKPYFDPNLPGNENGGSFTIVLTEGQSVRMYAFSVRRGTYIIDYTVE